MELSERYGQEAPTPSAANAHETIRYIFDETQRRAFASTKGLTETDLEHDPGHGAWPIGNILNHQLFLVWFMLDTLKPGSANDLPRPNFSDRGDLDLAYILEMRETLAERFREVLKSVTPEVFMEKRPDLPPEGWSDWPVLMRILRPLTDLATHTGQVNYARRQLGKPVGG